MHTISWKEFFTLMGAGLLFYYGWLLWKYFPYAIQKKNGSEDSDKKSFGYPAKLREEEKIVASAAEGAIGQKEKAPERTVMQPIGDRSPAPGRIMEEQKKAGDQEDHLQPEEMPLPIGELAKALCEEINALVDQSAKEEKPRGELIYAFKQLLDKEVYEPMKGGFFRAKINEHIVSALARDGSIHLDAEELNGLWIR